ncbi:hypothetical protein DNTS_018462 [Danionella cerebrum]|uniref:Doublecortin domain-containing protein n=1 Tax=Danionella cerebrum TaxID=2873325 RepID=A0A553Q935_9TELE|nr:hypothetical protein DNTS_018462 [Danionella translucida]
MSEAPVTRRAITKAQSTASGHTQMTSRQPYITETPASKRVCFYKSGDAQFSGLPVVINSRTFKTFEALLDSLSKRVPLPFGVRTITTPRGHTSVRSLDQLHHGQSYICSDRRTVKPIDLERARRKLPPWYHARPVSARYFAWYAHNPAKHERRMARRSEHGVLLHSPKWLVLFRNGEADVKHRLKLQRRTTYSFEALLDRISEVMHFPVLKLYTPEGKRVDGLPALILCSGMLVAAGREPFKRRTYEVQKSSPSKWLQAKRLGRRHPITRKKKFRSNRSCPFSPSSENYFVNQIKSSMPGSLGDFPNNPNGSVEVEPVQHRESVTETELIRSLYCEQEDMPIPSDDDIEKSFRVNQDGTMTVEMKVRLTIKEAETIHWTTTVSRSNVINQSDPAIGYCSDQDANLLSQYDRVAEEVSRSKIHEQTEMDVSAAGTELEQHASARAQFLTQGSIECLETATDTEQISSYFYKEELENEEVNQEEYTTQHTLHPVPKPRCIMATEMNTASRVQSSNYRSSETFLIHDNQTNRHEKVLNIYESQTCQVLQNVPLGLPEKGSLSNGSPRGYLKSPDNIFPASLRKANGSAMEKPTTASACRGDALNPAATKRKPRVREELATLNYVIESMAVTPHEDSLAEGKTKVYSTEQCSSENALEDYVNIYVHSVIDKAVDAHLRHSDNSQSFKAGSLAVPETDEDQVMNANPSNVKKKNTYTIMRTFHGDAPASDSDICEDMPSSESSFGVEMLALRGKKDQELINVKLKKQEVSIDMKHPKKDSGVRVGRKGGINEESEEWEEENSKSNKNKNEGIKSSDSLACRGHQNASVKEKVKEPVQNTSYFNEYCPQERQTGTSLTGLNSKVQLCSKNNSSGNQQKQCLSIQTEDKSQSQTQTIEKDTPPPERQPPDHVHVDLNAETCEKRHSMTCKAFSLESGTYSEEEQVILEAPECYTIYQEKFVEISEEAIECEENKLNFENDRASTIEKLTCSQQDKSKAIDPKNTEKTRVENLNVTNLEASKISVPRASTSMDSLSSSLAFSYDSKNSAPGRDSEEFSQSNRVKTIRDMFLVKSNADIPRSQTQLSSPNLSDYQPDSSEGKELSKSSEILREEKGPCRLSVARGYVKRTIEQLYGKTTKGSSLSEKRSISAESTKKREGLRATSTVSRSPIHDDHTSSTPDLSYFNPTSSVDGFHEQTQCVTLNARVGPKDAVLIDKGRWLLRENQVSPKCTSKNDDACEQVKETSTKSEHGSGNEDVPYSLFGHSPMKFEKKSSASEQTEIKECLAKTITYFHLPNDSEIQTEEQKAEAAERKDEFEVKPSAEPQQSSTTVFTSMHGKKYANKVHPIVETASPVVAQPTKKQSTEVARLSTEPDAIEMLYLFCGQHCPIL